MIRRLTISSPVVSRSDEKIKEIFRNREQRRKILWLVEKWREQVPEEEERRAMKILEELNLDTYKVGNTLPADWLWIKS